MLHALLSHRLQFETCNAGNEWAVGACPLSAVVTRGWVCKVVEHDVAVAVSSVRSFGTMMVREIVFVFGPIGAHTSGCNICLLLVVFLDGSVGMNSRNWPKLDKFYRLLRCH